MFSNKSLHKDRPTPNPSFFVVNNGSNADKIFYQCHVRYQRLVFQCRIKDSKTMIFTGKDVAA